MKRISRVFLFGAVTVILLAAACAPEEGAPIVAGALQATDTTGTAETATATADTTLTPSIPVTGLEVITLDCQYCVDNIAHAQLLIPRDAKFEVISPEELASPSGNNNDDADKEGNDDNGNNNGDDDDDKGGDDKGDRLGCRTIDRFRDTQLVLCRAEENTTITLNICLKDKTTCTEVQITLQSCAPTATPTPFVTITATATGTAATFTPVPITETATVTTATPVGSATATPTPAVVTNTPIASATNTPTATPTTTSTPTP